MNVKNLLLLGASVVCCIGSLCAMEQKENSAPEHQANLAQSSIRFTDDHFVSHDDAVMHDDRSSRSESPVILSPIQDHERGIELQEVVVRLGALEPAAHLAIQLPPQPLADANPQSVMKKVCSRGDLAQINIHQKYAAQEIQQYEVHLDPPHVVIVIPRGAEIAQEDRPIHVKSHYSRAVRFCAALCPCLSFCISEEDKNKSSVNAI